MLPPTRWRSVKTPTPWIDQDSEPVGHLGIGGSVATVFTRLNSPTTGAPAIPLLEQFISPLPHQHSGVLHPYVLHHPQIEGTKFIQTTPFSKQRIIGIGKKRVIKLPPQALFKRPKTGKIHNKSATIKLLGAKPKREATAVAVHKTAMPLVGPLAMATGVTLEQLAAAEGSGGNGHNTDEEGNGMNAAGGSRLGM